MPLAAMQRSYKSICLHMYTHFRSNFVVQNKYMTCAAFTYAFTIYTTLSHKTPAYLDLSALDCISELTILLLCYLLYATVM